MYWNINKQVSMINRKAPEKPSQDQEKYNIIVVLCKPIDNTTRLQVIAKNGTRKDGLTPREAL